MLKTMMLGILLAPFLVISSTIYQVNFYESNWEKKTPGDCLMVLGSKVLKGNVPDLMMRERVATAKEHITPQTNYLLLTGGTVDEKIAEAKLLAALLKDKGVDEKKMLLEEKSTSTYQNLLYSKPLLEEAGCENLDIVSHDFHLARVKLTAEKLEIPTNRLIPAEKMKENTKQRLTREYLAYLWYWFGWEWLEE